jgi:hypothetical protein
MVMEASQILAEQATMETSALELRGAVERGREPAAAAPGRLPDVAERRSRASPRARADREHLRRNRDDEPRSRLRRVRGRGDPAGRAVAAAGRAQPGPDEEAPCRLVVRALTATAVRAAQLALFGLRQPDPRKRRLAAVIRLPGHDDRQAARTRRAPIGLRYMSEHIGQLYVREDCHRAIETTHKKFRWTHRKALQKWGDKAPPCAQQGESRGPDRQEARRRSDLYPRAVADAARLYDRDRIDYRGKPILSSTCASTTSKCSTSAGSAAAADRVALRKSPMEDYGRSPASTSFRRSARRRRSSATW